MKRLLILIFVLVSIQVSAQVPGEIRNFVVSTSYITITYDCDLPRDNILVYIWEDDRIVFCNILKPGDTYLLKTISTRLYKTKCYSVYREGRIQLFDESRVMLIDKQGRTPIGYDKTHLTTCNQDKA
jgi:hypothetical protein